MIRIEFFFFLGLLFGIVIGLLLEKVRKLITEYNEEKLKKELQTALLSESLPKVKTKELLQELSKRDDIHY